MKAPQSSRTKESPRVQRFNPPPRPPSSIAELSSERPTPRKIQQSPAKMRQTPSKQMSSPAAIPNGAIRSQSAGHAINHAQNQDVRLQDGPHTNSPVSPYSPTTPNSIRRVNVGSREAPAIRSISLPVSKQPMSVKRLPANPSLNGVLRNANDEQSTENHVNGIVRQLNGPISETDSLSVAAASEKRQPPKLKRKAPG